MGFKDLIIFCVFAGTLYSQAAPVAGGGSPPALVAKPAPNRVARVATRKNIAIDYNSWFENIRIKGGTPYDTKALLYGLGVSFEYVTLRQTWGWGTNIGVIQGSAVAGDSTDATSYYARRVALNILRLGGRIFQRVNPRFDFGFAASALFTLKDWPPDKGLTVDSPSGLMIGGFLDGRWRLDNRWELIQALGTYSRGPSLAWRLGASYSF